MLIQSNVTQQMWTYLCKYIFLHICSTILATHMHAHIHCTIFHCLLQNMAYCTTFKFDTFMTSEAHFCPKIPLSSCIILDVMLVIYWHALIVVSLSGWLTKSPASCWLSVVHTWYTSTCEAVRRFLLRLSIVWGNAGTYKISICQSAELSM